MPLYHDTPPLPAQQSTSTTSSGGGTQSKAVPAALTTAGESGKKDTMNATKGLTAAFFDGMKKRLLESIDEEMHGDISSMDSVTVVNEIRVVFQNVRALHQSKWFPKIYQKTEPLFTAIDKFSGVIDNAVQLASFSAAGPIWGIIKWSFKFVESEATLYIQLVEDLERFDKDLCLAHDLSTIGQLSEALAEAIKDVYAAIIDYWLFVPKLYTQKKRILGIRLDAHTIDYAKHLAPLKGKVHECCCLLYNTLHVHMAEIATKKEWSSFTNSIDNLVSAGERYLDRINLAKTPGTCQWIEDTIEYKNWRSGEPYWFWLSGLPGTGKTYITSHLIKTNLQQQPETLYYLCQHDETGLSEVVIWQTLCFQLFDVLGKKADTGQLPKRTLTRLWERHTLRTLSGFDGSSSCFEDLLTLVPETNKVAIYIDGLDEVPDKSIPNLLAWLWQFSDKTLGRVQVFISSRPTLGVLTYTPKSVAKNCYKLELTPNHVGKDIQTFAKHEFDPHTPTNDLARWEQQRNTIIEKLPELSRGQFQWASLVVKELKKGDITLEYVCSSLQEDDMPRNLPELYIHVIKGIKERIGRENWRRTECLLRWLACALRPLRLDEVIDILDLHHNNLWQFEGVETLNEHSKFHQWSSKPEAKNCDESEIKKREDDDALCEQWMKDILQSCGCLVEFRSGRDGQLRSSTLHFVHLSVKEFLLGLKSTTVASKSHVQVPIALPFFNSRVVHATLFWNCVTYLTQDNFIDPLMKTITSANTELSFRGNAFDRTQLSRRPLFEYAALYWPRHLGLSSDAATVPASCKHLQRFFEHRHVRTWMEGVIGLNNGLEWLHRASSLIDTWLQEHKVPLKTVPAFDQWAADISGEPFKEYEPVLLHNTNEVHYLDSEVLFPLSIARNPSFLPSASLRQEIFQDLDAHLALFQPKATVDLSSIGSDLSFPTGLFLGETGDNGYGFIAQDYNPVLGEYGIFLVDRKVNHPRLLWLPLADQRGLRLEASPRRRELNSVYHSDKMGGHNLWTTLSATLRADGTALAAIFSEPPPRTPDSPGATLHFKVILWEFKHERVGVTATPSSAAYTSDSWTSVAEIRLPEEIIVPEQSIFSQSSSLVAFHGERFLLTPAGIFDYRNRRVLHHNPWEEIKKVIKLEATVVPGGLKIAGFTSPSRNTLAIITLAEGNSYGLIESTTFCPASAISGADDEFLRIVSCSESGSHLGLTIKTASGKIAVGILQLASETFTAIYETSADMKVDFTHFLFDMGSEKPKSMRKEPSNTVRYIAFIEERTYIRTTYTLIVYAFDDDEICCIMQEEVLSKPDGLLFFDDNHKEGISLVLLSNGRRSAQYRLSSYDPLDLLDERERINATRTLVVTNYDLKPDSDGKTLNHSLLKLESTMQSTPNSYFTTSATVISQMWRRRKMTENTFWKQVSNLSIKLTPMRHRTIELSQHGIVSSSCEGPLAVWVGSSLQFIMRSGNSGLRVLPTAESPIVDVVCTAIKFTSSARAAASIWRPVSNITSQNDWLLRIHGMSSNTARLLSSLVLGPEPQSLASHPSEDVFAISLRDDLQIVRVIEDTTVCLIHKVSTDQLRGPYVQVYTKPNGPASPPSTENTSIQINSDEDFAFQWSCCSRFLYNQSWNRFVEVSTLDQGPQENRPFIYQLSDQEGVNWNSISSERPVVMEEDVLYAAGQQRFKIFKIRTYLVLGWSADGTNLWWKKLDRTTWYRQVICAIPLSLINWRATMIWPKAKDHRLVVVFHPVETGEALQFPVSISSPLLSKEIVPEYVGWLKGHAAGCPYHLGIVTKG